MKQQTRKDCHLVGTECCRFGSRATYIKLIGEND